MDTSHAIHAQDLTKRYGVHAALDAFSLDVPAGTVHGLLGPNGAGKTTAVRLLTTLARIDEGRATVAGHDVGRRPQDVKRCIGLVGQHAAVDEILTARQNLVMFGRLHHLGTRRAAERADELLERFGLAEHATTKPVEQFSGGMRRRLDLAAGLILDPPVLFLDEPTTGLDPRGRQEVWDTVQALAADGTTVLLTTQYLEEADRLADHITVIDHGRTRASGTPDELKRRLGRDRLELTVRDEEDLPRAADLVARVTGHAPAADDERRTLSAPAGLDQLAAAVTALHDEHIPVDDLGLRRPTLDEVFLHLTDKEPTPA